MLPDWPASGALLLGIALPAVIRPAQAERRSTSEEFVNYASPLELLFSPDGARLYVLASKARKFACWMRPASRRSRTFRSGGVPRGFALSPKGDRLFVTNSWDDTLSVIDTQRLEVVATWHVGAEPSGVVEDREGNAPLCGQPHFK